MPRSLLIQTSTSPTIGIEKSGGITPHTCPAVEDHRLANGIGEPPNSRCHRPSVSTATRGAPAFIVCVVACARPAPDAEASKKFADAPRRAGVGLAAAGQRRRESSKAASAVNAGVLRRQSRKLAGATRAADCRRWSPTPPSARSARVGQRLQHHRVQRVKMAVLAPMPSAAKQFAAPIRAGGAHTTRRRKSLTRCVQVESAADAFLCFVPWSAPRHRRLAFGPHGSQTAPAAEPLAAISIRNGAGNHVTGCPMAPRFPSAPRARQSRDAHREGDRRRAAEARLRGHDGCGRYRCRWRAEGRSARAGSGAAHRHGCVAGHRASGPAVQVHGQDEWNGQQVGVMHACGHDNHMAILSAAATLFAS